MDEEMKKLKVVYFIPEELFGSGEVDEVLKLLEQTKPPKSIKFEYKVKKINGQEQKNLKLDTLLNLSVKYGIGIQQTRKSKLLYSQLVVYLNGNLWTFYPQERANAPTITIHNFLNALNNGNFVGHHIMQIQRPMPKSRS